MSKLLKRALKTAVLPASLLVAGKFLTILTIVTVWGFDMSVSNSAPSMFSVQFLIADSTNALFTNSIANLVTLLLIAIPTFYLLIRRTLLQDAQSNPRTVVKLTKFNVLKWVTKQETVLMPVLIWTVFLWIICGVTIANTVALQTYSWIGISAGVLEILSAWGLLRTFEVETDKIYPKSNNQYM